LQFLRIEGCKLILLDLLEINFFKVLVGYAISALFFLATNIPLYQAKNSAFLPFDIPSQLVVLSKMFIKPTKIKATII
jgi:hypothetical protein